MKEYLLEKYKKVYENSIFGSEDGPEGGGTNVNQANADRLSSGFARLMPPLANDLLLSSADLTASDFVSEGPIEGFVDNNGASCSPLEATFLDGTVVAETASLKKQSQPLIIQKLSGVEFNYKPFVSGELNNYVDYLNSRFVHKEPIVNHSWIQGRSDTNGDYNSTVNTFRGGVVNPLQDINDILNCTRQGLKNTIMRWGPGAKGAGGATDTAQMEIAPNEMLYRYAGAGFRKVPYSYRKIYHPNSVVNKTDYSIPNAYVFSEDQPVLYQGSYDFGCSITERGFLDRSFCNRAFFKFIANPTSTNGGNYTNHQRFCATAVRLTGHYDDRFSNGKPGKYTYSLAAQAEPEGLKEPIIDTVASAINSIGLDYWKPIRFHESYVQLLPKTSAETLAGEVDHHSHTRLAGKANKTPKNFDYRSGTSTESRSIDDGIVTYNTWTSRRIYVEKSEASYDANTQTVTPYTNQTTPGASGPNDQPKLVANLGEENRLFSEKLVVMDEPEVVPESQAAVIQLNWVIYSTDVAVQRRGGSVLKTRSWKLDSSNPVSFVRRGVYFGTPTLVLDGLTAYTPPADSADMTAGSLPTITFEVGEGGALTNNYTVTNEGRVDGAGVGSSQGNVTIQGIYSPESQVAGSTYSVTVNDVNPSPFVSSITRAFLQEGSLPGVSGNTQRWYKPNKTYRITGSLHFPSSNVKVDSFNFYLLGDQSQGIEGQNIATVGPFKDDNWRDFDFEFTNSGNRSFRKMRFNLKKGDDFTGLTQTGDFIGIRDFTVLEKTLGGEEQAKDPRIAYMTFAATDFLSTGTTLNVGGVNYDYPFTTDVSLGGDAKIDFSLDGTPINVGDPNALKFVFPKITGFDLSTKQINESITLRTVTNETTNCGTRYQEDMKYPFVTGAENTETIGFQLKESETEDVEGSFLWPVWVGDSPPKNTAGNLDTGKLLVRIRSKNEDLANNPQAAAAVQSGIDNGWDVFGYVEPDAPVNPPSSEIVYLHVENPNLGAPDANVTGKSLNITVQQNQPETFNFNNFRIDYNLGEENQQPLSNESVTSIEYNKNIFGPNEIFRAGAVIGEKEIATAEVSLSRFDYGTGPLSHRGATYYRWRIDSVNITDGGSNYSNNVTLNFNSNLEIYQDPNPTINVSNGVVQSVTFATTADKGEFAGSGFIFGNYSAHTYGSDPPTVTAQIVDEGEGGVVAGDLSLNLTGDNTDYNYGMRKYSAIDGTASSDIEPDGTYQSDWMENLPLNSDITPLIHTVNRRDVDCVKVTLIIESLYQQIIQEQDPLATSIKRDGLTINFSIFTYFDGVVEDIYPKNETKISYFGTVSDFYAVDTDEIILPTYSDLLPFYPGEDVKSLSQKFPRIVEIRKNDFETNSVRMGRDARVFQVIEVVKERFKYPFSAIMKTTLDARTFREPPNKQWRLRLKRVQVPSNYYPLDLDGSDKRFVKNVSQLGTRIVYDGDWDGTFKLAWTDNPAWILYDLLTNQRYGIGNRIDDLEDINIFNLYKIGRYCDSVDDNGHFVGLDDGVGGLEPRFSCNIMLASAQNAFKTINDICTVFNGMAFWANGRLDFFADQPKDPMTFFNNENVFDGIFNYQTTSKSSLFNVAEVTFLDKRDDFTAKKETVIDEESMRQNGILRRDINGKGCTSRAQAARLGRYILYTNKLEREIVNFKTSSQSLMLSIGDVIEIQDDLKNFEASYGKLLEYEVNSVGHKFIKIEDRPNVNSILTNHSGAFVITPTGQDTLTELYDHIKGGNLVTNEILNNLYDPQAVKLKVTGAQQDGNQIKIGVSDSNSYLNDVPTGSLINLDLQNRRKHQYRVLSIKPEEDNLYAVTATEYRKEKFDLIETKEDFKIEEEDSFNVGIPNHVIKNITEPIGFDANVVTVNSRERHIQFEITGSSNGNETAYQLTAIAPNGKVDSKIVPKAEDISVGNNYYLTKGEIKDVHSFGTYNFEVKSLGSEDIFGTPSSIDFTSSQVSFVSDGTDSDGDGLTDFYENTVSFTDPNNTDTDFDGLSDSAEINTHGTNPLSKDSDNDGVDDGVELDLGQNPAVFTDYNPLVSGFRITNALQQSGEYYTLVGKGEMSLPSGLPLINGLYELSGTANGKPQFAGRRHSYTSVQVGGGYNQNYISSNNPYKNIYTAGAGVVKYTVDGYWKIQTNTTAQSYDERRDFQQWTGGSGVDYPWQVTDWVQVLQSGTFELAEVDYSNPQNKPEPSGPRSSPRIFFTYLGDGTLVDFAPKL